MSQQSQWISSEIKKFCNTRDKCLDSSEIKCVHFNFSILNGASQSQINLLNAPKNSQPDLMKSLFNNCHLPSSKLCVWTLKSTWWQLSDLTYAVALNTCIVGILSGYACVHSRKGKRFCFNSCVKRVRGVAALFNAAGLLPKGPHYSTSIQPAASLHIQLRGRKTAWGLWYRAGGMLGGENSGSQTTLTPLIHTCNNISMLLLQVWADADCPLYPISSSAESLMGSVSVKPLRVRAWLRFQVITLQSCHQRVTGHSINILKVNLIYYFKLIWSEEKWMVPVSPVSLYATLLEWTK